MGREIKFRGQRKDNGKWVYGDLIHGVNHKQGKFFILPIRGGVIGLGDGIDPIDGYEVIPESVGQFIGMEDCNGKEIYEGDIISVNGEHEKIVRYIDDQYGFCVANISDLKNSEWMYIWQRPAQNWWNDFKGGIKIIGNIYANKE